MTKHPRCNIEDCQQAHFKMQMYAYVRQIFSRKLTTYMSFISLLKETPVRSKKYNQYIKVLENCCTDIELFCGEAFKAFKSIGNKTASPGENPFIWEFLDKLNKVKETFSNPKTQLLIEHINISKKMIFYVNEVALYQIILHCVRLAMQNEGTVHMGCVKITRKDITFHIENLSVHLEPSKRQVLLKALKKNYLLDVPTNEYEIKMAFIFHYIRLLKCEMVAKMTQRGKINFKITIPRNCKNEV